MSKSDNSREKKHSSENSTKTEKTGEPKSWSERVKNRKNPYPAVDFRHSKEKTSSFIDNNTKKESKIGRSAGVDLNTKFLKIENIPFQYTGGQLKGYINTVMKKYACTFVKVMKDTNLNSLGYAFAEFEHGSDVLKALEQFDGKSLGPIDRRIYVTLCPICPEFEHTLKYVIGVKPKYNNEWERVPHKKYKKKHYESESGSGSENDESD
jgi:hypothetical protein